MLAFVWKTLLGIVLCATPLTAILVIGYASRAMQRAVLKTWYTEAVLKTWYTENGGDTVRGSFPEFARATPALRRLAHWPNWFLAEDLGERLREGKAEGAGPLRRCGILLVSLFAALWANLRIGTVSLVATWVATLPLMLLWLFAWWGGWENSFNKGYEQAWVGPAIGAAATVLFVLVMTYVPIAQVRLATSGTWRSFFDYRLIRSLVAGHPFALLKLAAYFVLAGLVLMAMRAAPLAIGNAIPDLGQWPEPRLMALKLGYFGLCAALAFAFFLALRLAAARIYAHALLKAMRTGRLRADRLSDMEREGLAALHLLEPEARPERGIAARAAASTGMGVVRLAAGLPILALWFVFVAELYVSQFLNHDWLAWINHPLVQLPWMPVMRLLGGD